MHILKLRVNSLFGKYSIELDLTQKASILYGANGVGKTTLLRLYTSLLNNDFVEILRWDFQSIEIVALEHENFNHMESKVERTFLIKRTDLLPDMDTMSRYYAKFYLCNQPFYYSDLDTVDYDALDTFEQYAKALFDDLMSHNLYYQYLCNCLFDLNNSGEINDIIHNHDSSGTLYNKYMPKAVKQLHDNRKTEWWRNVLSFTPIESYFTDDEVGLSDCCFYDGKTNNNYREPTYYIDLVKNFDFVCPKHAETVYTSHTLKWLSEAKEIWGFGDDMYGQRIHNIEDTISFLSGAENLLQMSEYLSYLSGTSYSDFLYDIYSKLNDFTTNTIDSERNEYSITESLMKNLIEKREININALISANYYLPAVALDVNRKTASFCNKVLKGDIYWNIHDTDYDWIDKEDKDKYTYLFSEFDPMLFVDQFFKDEINMYLINTYVRPIICKEFVVSAENCFNSLDNLNSDIAVSNLLLCYLFYKEIIPVLTDESARNPKIDCLEMLLNKYFYDKEVKILPSGIFVKTIDQKEKTTVPFYRTTNDYIELNSLSSGEKKILLLLTLMLFFDGLSALLDEPELSLSIVWQEKLLLDIIENGVFNNIIVATHSPYMAMNETVQQYMVFIPDEDR